MKWEIGAKMRILDKSKIFAGDDLTNGGVYGIHHVCHLGRCYITDDAGDTFFISEGELASVERVFTSDDYAEIASRGELAEYEMSDAELGEPSEAPSADCNCECDCGNLAEGISDIKAMIGRLIRNGGDE